MNIKSETIKRYIDYFIDSFLVSRAVRYDIKGKKHIGSPYKYYFADMGLRNALLNFRQVEPTHIMENIIYNHLVGEGYQVDLGSLTHYTRNDEGKTRRSTLEVDFVCNRGSERVYIQSAYSIPDEKKGSKSNVLLCSRAIHLPKLSLQPIIFPGIRWTVAS